jgi:chromate transporter
MDVANMLAISESTPGPIGVNMATYVGYGCAGIPGGIAATLGLTAPCILVILLIGAVLDKYRSNRYVNAAFYGLRPASTALIAAAGWSVLVLVLTNRALFTATGQVADLFRWGSVAIFLLLWVLTNRVPRVKKFHPIVFIVFSAVLGIVFRLGGV